VQAWSTERDEVGMEPAQIVEFDREGKRVVLRRMLRKHSSDPKARANELIITNELFTKPPSQVVRKCEILSISAEDAERGRMPTPYGRGGAADLFFTIRQTSLLEPMRESAELGDDNKSQQVRRTTAARTWDPKAPVSTPKLRGMGIFCGGGNLDRGLEEGGAVEFDYAVDWAPRALHSYRANTRNSKCQYYLGSVNDYSGAALSGSESRNVAYIGAIDVLAAGSPCPGFSLMQQNPNSNESLTNASMIASVVAFVDLYSPRYFFLENVLGMTRGMGFNKDQCVFAQLLAALVALGYQVQQFLMEAWSYGSPQSRSRVFIVASTPGSEPLSAPPYTHAHPKSLNKRDISLGRSGNGLPFGVRRDDYTPFAHLSPREAVRHLPKLGDALPHLCPTYPDHRTPCNNSEWSRSVMAVVPTTPHGMGLIKSFHESKLPGKVAERVRAFGKVRRSLNSKSYSRVIPDHLFPTFTTVLQPHDSNLGRALHWDEHRSLTVMEAQIAQGFLEHEVIIGNPRQQMTIIGNSVDRKVSLALGVSLRHACEAGEAQEDDEDDDDNDDHDHDNDTAAMDPDEHIHLGDVGMSESSTPVPDSEMISQSRAGTLRLSDAQIDDIRTDGFKAIERILAGPLPSRTLEKSDVPL